MSNLSERVKKAKQLQFTSKSKRQYNTWGTDDIHYTIGLSSGKKEIITPDGYLIVSVFYTKCEAHNYSDDLTVDNCTLCKGNIKHTVCYHCLGAIYQSFQEIGRSVSFHSTYRSADRALTLGKFLAKIENQNGKGCVWVVIKDNADNQSKLPVFNELPETQIEDGLTQEEALKIVSSAAKFNPYKPPRTMEAVRLLNNEILDAKTNNRLLYGNEDDEGID